MTVPPPSRAGPLFRVAVIGGGIGGLFCALALQHHCASPEAGPRPLEVDVYEQAEAYGDVGAGIGVGVNAARVAARLGLTPQLQAIAGVASGGVWLSFRRFDTGAEITTVRQPPGGAEPVAGQTVRQVMVARSDLLGLLVRETERRSRPGAVITLHTNKACVAVEEATASHSGDGNSGGPIAVRFQDGMTVTADLVIGCDGIHSKVRGQFYHDRPVHSGITAYRGVVPMGTLLEEWPVHCGDSGSSDGGTSPSYNNVWVAKHRHLIAYPIAQNRLLNVVGYVTRADDRRAEADDGEAEGNTWLSACDRDEMEIDFHGFDKAVQRIIGGLGSRVHRWRVYEREPVSRWHFYGGRVVLLGDAAHAMLPYMGAGAGQAIEDAWVLGRAVADWLSSSSSSSSSSAKAPKRFATLAQAMQCYQDVRSPRAQRVQDSSRAAVHLYEMQNEAMRGLSFEESVPILANTIERPIQRVFEEDVDEMYQKLAGGLGSVNMKSSVL